MKLIQLAATSLSLAMLLPLGSSPAENLPDAPSLKMRRPVETYSPDERMIVHNSPSVSKSGPKILDWSFITGHAIYGASVAFDDYLTARHVGTCAFEGNPDLGRMPSSKAIAMHGAVEFAAVVAGDAALKWFGRRQAVPGWLNSLGSNLGAAIGTGKHVRGGAAWVRNCY